MGSARCASDAARLAPAINGHYFAEVPMPEFIGATLGAAIALAAIAVAYQRWGYSA